MTMVSSCQRPTAPHVKTENAGGGRVYIATKETIIAEPLPELDTECELRWVKIHLEAAKTVDPQTPQLNAYRNWNGQSALFDKETLKPYFSSEATSALLASIGIPSHMCQRSPRRRNTNSCCRSLQTSTWTS